jgi:hypothetical protein
MRGTAVQTATDRGAAWTLKTRVTHEWPYPDDPIRCLLWQVGDTVSLLINTAHGKDAYDHAAYHAEQGVEGLAFVCRVDAPCGYTGRPRTCAAVEPDGVRRRP